MKYVNMSDHELGVLVLAARGLKVKQIALEMHFSEATIRYHLRYAREKLEAKNTTHAVALAFRQGLIE